jgi:cytochrome b
LRIGGGVVHDAVVGYLVHNYCLRIIGGVVHDTVGYILYCPPLLFEVWGWSGS